MRYFLVAGEVSGDIHGAALMQALREYDLGAEFAYCGGEAMRTVAGGAEPVVHCQELAIMGFAEVLKKGSTLLRLQRRTRRAIRAFAPDRLILIDSSGFNLPLARYASRRGGRVVYYIPPKAWAWNRRRVHALRRHTEAVYPILPFEEAFYRRYGVNAHYLGNPLIDELDAALHSEDFPTLEAFRREVGAGEGQTLVALIPGSRRQEVERILPVMLRALSADPAMVAVVTAAPGLTDELYEKIIEQCRGAATVKLVRGRTHAAMRHCRAGLVTSGTATLEAALLGLPQVVLYRAHPASVAIARKLVRIPYFSLVNLILEAPCVPELIQETASPERAAQELLALLPEGKARQAQLEGYARLNHAMGSPGVNQRIAQSIIAMG